MLVFKSKHTKNSISIEIQCYISNLTLALFRVNRIIWDIPGLDQVDSDEMSGKWIVFIIFFCTIFVRWIKRKVQINLIFLKKIIVIKEILYMKTWYC